MKSNPSIKEQYTEYLRGLGAEILPIRSEWEVVRYQKLESELLGGGILISVVYRDKKGNYSFSSDIAHRLFYQWWENRNQTKQKENPMSKANNYEIHRCQYVKESGEQSERRLVVIAQPNPNLYAYDVTEMGTPDIIELQSLLRRHKAELAALNLPFKSFKPAGLTVLEIERETVNS